jgi:hypothetical protein
MQDIPSDFKLCATTIASVAPGEPEIVKAALAWVVRNRINGTKVGGETIAVACRTLINDLINSAQQAPPADERDFWRSMAAVCLVWSDDCSDPTGGARRCHRHTSYPEWAQRRLPTALIGPLVFYV